METQEFRIPKDKIKVKDHIHSHEERQSNIISRGISQGERISKLRPSFPSSTKLKDTANTSPYIPGKGEDPPNPNPFGKTSQVMIWNIMEISAQNQGEGTFFEEQKPNTSY